MQNSHADFKFHNQEVCKNLTSAIVLIRWNDNCMRQSICLSNSNIAVLVLVVPPIQYSIFYSKIAILKLKLQSSCTREISMKNSGKNTEYLGNGIYGNCNNIYFLKSCPSTLIYDLYFDIQTNFCFTPVTLCYSILNYASHKSSRVAH